MRAAIAVAMVGGVLLASMGPARADGDRSDVIVADVAADAVLIVGAKTGSTKVLLLGTAAYALAAPAVHAYHDRWTEGGESLALRVILPVGLGGIGCKILGSDDDDDDDDDGGGGPAIIDFGCLFGAAVGFSLGAISAQVIDWSVLSTGEDPAPAARQTMFTIGGRF